jgi:hypothetical protein
MPGAIHNCDGCPDTTDLFMNVGVIHKRGGRPGITDLFINVGSHLWIWGVIPNSGWASRIVGGRPENATINEKDMLHEIGSRKPNPPPVQRPNGR